MSAVPEEVEQTQLEQIEAAWGQARRLRESVGDLWRRASEHGPRNRENLGDAHDGLQGVMGDLVRAREELFEEQERACE